VAFESFRAQERGRPRTLRRIAFALVALFHGVLIAAGVAYSYWHVEELTPPTLRVTFMSAPPPPPPPPPPPAGGGSRAKKVAVKTKPVEPIVVPKPNEIVQPPEKTKPVKKEFRKHEDEYVEEDDAKPAPVGKGIGKGSIDGDEDGEDDGVVGGVKGGAKGGIIGGAIGGIGTAPAPPRQMPGQFGALQKLAGDDVDLPSRLWKADAYYVVEAMICVSPSGGVDRVSITKRADSLLDEKVVSTVMKTWRFRPMKFNGTFAPFCYPAKFEFKPKR
jgi:protein TonB